MEILRTQAHGLVVDQQGRMQRGVSAGVILILSGSLWLGIIELARLVIG